MSEDGDSGDYSDGFQACLAIENVYYSTQINAFDHYDKIKENGISHILLLCDKPKRLRISREISKLQLNTKKKPISKIEWITKFQQTNKILAEGTSKGGVWIIGDESIIKALVGAFIISNTNSSVQESMIKLKEMRHVPLTEDLFIQLQLLSAMGPEPDRKFLPWVKYEEESLSPRKEKSKSGSPQTRRRTYYSDCKSRMLSCGEAYRAGTLDLFNLPTLGEQNWGYCCSTCETRLFSNTNVFKHNNTTDFQPVLNDNYPCSFVSIEPLRWMEGISKNDRGCLYCYSCASEIGEWEWKESKCEDCHCIIPFAFLLNISALTFVEPPTVKQERSSGRSGSAGNLWRLLSSEKIKAKPNAAAHRVCSRIVASNCQGLPGTYQRMLVKEKISFEKGNENWFIMKQALCFCGKIRIYSQEIPERSDVTEIDCEALVKLPIILKGIPEFCRGTEFEERIEKLMEAAKGMDIQRVLDHPLVMEYLLFVEGSWHESEFPFVNIRVPNYIDLATETFLNSSDPRDLFKLEKHKAGKGGYGKVYIAKRVDTGKKIAVKKMDHNRVADMARNYKEVAILATSSHPNIVDFLDCYRLDKELWVTMDYLEGGTLSDLANLRPFSEKQIAFIAQECLKGLQYLHSKGLCHRDIKPKNVMLTDNCEVKLIDFGFCDSVQLIAEYPKMVGSPMWMAPEMIFHAPQTLKADVWSLGCTLFQLIDKEGFTMGGKLRTIFTVACEGRSQLVGTKKKLSSKLVNFLRSMLHRHPQKRASVDELLEHPFLTSQTITKDCMVSCVNQLLSTKTAFKM